MSKSNSKIPMVIELRLGKPGLPPMKAALSLAGMDEDRRGAIRTDTTVAIPSGEDIGEHTGRLGLRSLVLPSQEAVP